MIKPANTEPSITDAVARGWNLEPAEMSHTIIVDVSVVSFGIKDSNS